MAGLREDHGRAVLNCLVLPEPHATPGPMGVWTAAVRRNRARESHLRPEPQPGTSTLLPAGKMGCTPAEKKGQD